jgi:hypothetical protein
MTLNDEIHALNNVLIKYGEGRWKLPTVHSRNDVTHVLQMFGGMGSLNDLYICQINGHSIEKSQEPSVNNMIREHLENIHKGCVNFAAKS